MTTPSPKPSKTRSQEILVNINKDKILVCKDCELRYICSDCRVRAHVEGPEDILPKPLKCAYDPYTGEWSEWSRNPLSQKPLIFMGWEIWLNR